MASRPEEGSAVAGENVASEPRRVRILAELRSAGELGVTELAAAVGLHPNTVRWHLGQLGDAGLITSTSVHEGRPGRPRIVFRAVEEQPAEAPSYRLLAELLASALAQSPTGPEDARTAGRAWGRHLVERPGPYAHVSREQTLQRIARLFKEHGFSPELTGSTLLMRNCPFKELVDSYGSVICSLHGGLLAGSLEELGADVDLVSLEPYARPGVCVAELGPRRADAPGFHEFFHDP